MFKNILVPVDGSDQSLQSARVAVDLAIKNNGKVHLLHVIRPYAFDYMGMDGREMVPGNASEIGERILNKIKDIVTIEDVRVSSAIAYGNPAQIIIEESKKTYDLIIMGSRGLGGISGMMLGSVSNQVSTFAHCPVLITRLGKEEKKVINECTD